MARFAQDKLEELRDRANIVEVIGTHVRLKRAGRNYVGLCPFHNEKTPSFSVNAERGFFHCFGCGVGGTVFDFVMRLEGLNFPETVQSLARRYGVTLPETQEPGAPPPGEREAMYRANEFAATFFSHLLWKTPAGEAARGYLKARSISEETARAFILGFAPTQPGVLANALKRRGLLEGAIKAGLVRGEGAALRDLFIGRLMFPIRDTQGRVVAFGGRVLDERLPKYINSSESPIYSKARNLYGLYEGRQALARADRAIVVEGYFDTIAVSQAGFKEVVASLGTSLTVEQLRILARYTRNVIACFDGDEAGRKASMRALEIFLGAGLLGRGIFIPSGFDPDTLILKRGAQSFGELVASSELLVNLFIAEERTKGVSPLAPLERKIESAERIAEKLRLIPSEVEFNLLVRKAVSVLGLGPREEEVVRRRAREKRTILKNPESQSTKTPLDPIRNAQILLLAVALRFPKLRAKIINGLCIADSLDARLVHLIGTVCASDKPSSDFAVEISSTLGEPDKESLTAYLLLRDDKSDQSSANGGPFTSIKEFQELDEKLWPNGTPAGTGLSEDERANAIVLSCLVTLNRKVRDRREVAELLHAAKEGSDTDAARKAQEVIALRRGASGDPA
ncbi:MAG TPA: DNA primase [Candidatus Binataceae bacterium]|nr:DNA primase [Candidatus Binataceae bacterium]